MSAGSRVKPPCEFTHECQSESASVVGLKSTITSHVSMLLPNGWVERRARRHLSLALYLSRVRSNEVLGVVNHKSGGNFFSAATNRIRVLELFSAAGRRLSQCLFGP